MTINELETRLSALNAGFARDRAKLKVRTIAARGVPARCDTLLARIDRVAAHRDAVAALMAEYRASR